MKPDRAQPRAGTLERSFSASLDELERFVNDMLGLLTACGLEDNGFALELIAREALGNAVLHGCKSDPAQTVSASFSVRPDRIELCVADSGPGFDWRNAPEWPPEPTCETGRGLCILKSYADSVEFNDSGNTVRIAKLLPVEEKAMSNDMVGPVQLTLEASVSAKNVQALRELFKQHLQDGARSMVLDFSQVQSIDSVGIGLLVATHNSLAKVGGSLSLANVGQDIFQLFTLMRLDKHFSVAPARAGG